MKRIIKSSSALETALSYTKRERNYAISYNSKTNVPDAMDRDVIKVALRFGDKAHYSVLSEKQLKFLLKLLEKGRSFNKQIEREVKIRDIDREIESLYKAIAKAEHFGNNESGDYNAISEYERRINELEDMKSRL